MAYDNSHIDWEAIEIDYRTRNGSVLAISRRHAVSETAIRKKAKDRGWQRDVSNEIRAQAKVKAAQALAGEVFTRSEAEEADFVEAASNELVRRITAQRSLVDKQHSILCDLVDAFKRQVSDKGFKLEAWHTIAIRNIAAASEHLIKLDRTLTGVDPLMAAAKPDDAIDKLQLLSERLSRIPA